MSIRPSRRRPKRPFGDHTGFYSLEDAYPVFHVTAVTHRRDAVYPATIVGVPPQEDAYIAKATEKDFPRADPPGYASGGQGSVYARAGCGP